MYVVYEISSLMFTSKLEGTNMAHNVVGPLRPGSGHCVPGMHLQAIMGLCARIAEYTLVCVMHVDVFD